MHERSQSPRGELEGQHAKQPIQENGRHRLPTCHPMGGRQNLALGQALRRSVNFTCAAKARNPPATQRLSG